MERERENKVDGGEVPVAKGHGNHALQALLRILGCAAAAVAAILMAFNHQTSDYGGLMFQANYKSVSAFKFFIGGNAVVGGYCLASLPFVMVLHGRKRTFIHLFDLLAMGLGVASFSAAASAAYVGKYGNDSTGWLPVCGYVPNFCDRSVVSLSLSFVGFLACFLLCLL